MRISIPAIALGLLLATGSPCKAEVLTDGRALNPASPMGKYLYSQGFLKEMYSLAVQVDRALGLACGQEYQIRPLMVVVLQPVDLPAGAGHAAAGVWAYRYDAVRCGTSKRYNLMFAAQSGAAPRPSMLVPGDTITSPVLARDALNVVSVQAGHSLGQCLEVRIADTALAELPHTVTENGKTYQGVWTENWTFQGCGNKVVIPVTFVPDGKGGTSFHTRL